MGFLNRGKGPSLRRDTDGDSNDGYVYSPIYRLGPITYIPLDNTYVIMQMIVTFIILVIGVITYLVTYQSTIIDPIEDIKKLFINMQLVIILLILVATFIINFFSKDEITLGKRLAIILVFSIGMMLICFGIKLNLDKIYTSEQFEQIYEKQNLTDSNTKSKLKVKFTEISLKTDKEFYVDECMELYRIFKIKTYGVLGIHLLLNALLIYQIIRMMHARDNKDKVNKDDLILYDEEDVFK